MVVFYRHRSDKKTLGEVLCHKADYHVYIQKEAKVMIAYIIDKKFCTMYREPSRQLLLHQENLFLLKILAIKRTSQSHAFVQKKKLRNRQERRKRH